MELPTHVFQTAQELLVLRILANVQAQVSASQASVTLLLTPACLLAQFQSQLAHIPLDVTAQATPSVSLATAILETRTIAFLTVLETQTSLILANAQVLLNVSQASVILLLTLAHLLVPSLSSLDLMPLDATVLAMASVRLATAI